MAIKQEYLEDEPAMLDMMIEEFRIARQRRLERQGIALRNRTEQGFVNAAMNGQPRQAKGNDKTAIA